jgi:hypothetical protein
MALVRTRLQTSMVCLVLLLGGCKPDQDKPEQNKPKQAKPVSGASDHAGLTSLAERLDSVEPGERVRVGSNRITPLEGQRLPNIAGGTQIPEGIVIYASMTELVVNDRPLAALQDGVPAAEVVHRHVILPLREQLEEEAAKARIVAETRGEEWSGRMLLAFDGRVPFSTVVDTMYTGGRTGFTSYAFIIQANPVERALLVAPPRSNASGDPGPRMELLIADDKLWVDVPGERRKLPKRESAGSGAEAWDQPGLAAIVGEFKQANPGASTAVVYAENHLPLEVLLGTFATLAGPGCDQAQPETCLLPDLIIMGGAG